MAASLAAAHVELHRARGETREAAIIIKRALTWLSSSAGAEGPLLTFARHGDDADLRRIGGLVDAHLDRDRIVLCAEATLVRAIVARRTGHLAAAAALAAEAAAMAAQARASLFVAFAAEVSGDTATARNLFRSMGMAHELSRLGDDEPVPRERASSTLSRREREVAEFVAAGLSNKAIAERLALSDRTVEHHIASVFSKLQMRSRAELAAFMSTHPSENASVSIEMRSP